MSVISLNVNKTLNEREREKERQRERDRQRQTERDRDNTYMLKQIATYRHKTVLHQLHGYKIHATTK